MDALRIEHQPDSLTTTHVICVRACSIRNNQTITSECVNEHTYYVHTHTHTHTPTHQFYFHLLIQTKGRKVYFPSSVWLTGLNNRVFVSWRMCSRRRRKQKGNGSRHQCTSMRQTSRYICSVRYGNDDVTAGKVNITCAHNQKQVTLSSLMAMAKCYTINALYQAFNFNTLFDFI